MRSEDSRWFASTKTCHICGYVNNDLTIADRGCLCPQCGTVHHRDQNAAQNLKGLLLDNITKLRPRKMPDLQSGIGIGRPNDID